MRSDAEIRKSISDGIEEIVKFAMVKAQPDTKMISFPVGADYQNESWESVIDISNLNMLPTSIIIPIVINEQSKMNISIVAFNNESITLSFTNTSAETISAYTVKIIFFIFN